MQARWFLRRLMEIVLMTNQVNHVFGQKKLFPRLPMPAKVHAVDLCLEATAPFGCIAVALCRLPCGQSLK